MPGIRTEADVYYFVDKCGSLSAVQKRAIRTAFVNMLKSRGICSQVFVYIVNTYFFTVWRIVPGRNTRTYKKFDTALLCHIFTPV